MFGVKPPCEQCVLPELLPENVPVWEVAQVMNVGQVDLLALLKNLGVDRPLPFLRKLAALRRAAAAAARPPEE